MFIPTWVIFIVLVYIFSQISDHEVSELLKGILGMGILFAFGWGIFLLIGAVSVYGLETVFGYVFGAMIIAGIPISIYDNIIKPIVKRSKNS